MFILLKSVGKLRAREECNHCLQNLYLFFLSLGDVGRQGEKRYSASQLPLHPGMGNSLPVPTQVPMGCTLRGFYPCGFNRSVDLTNQKMRETCNVH